MNQTTYRIGQLLVEQIIKQKGGLDPESLMYFLGVSEADAKSISSAYYIEQLKDDL